MAVEMSKDRKRGSGNGYQRDAAFKRDFRGGLRGASVAGGGVDLLQLIASLINDGS
jgi:hypothetical protein